MYKLVFEFENEDDMYTWHGYYLEGGGDSSMYDAWTENEDTDYPEIKIRIED